MATIGNIAVNLNANTKEFRKGISGAERKLKGFKGIVSKSMAVDLAHKGVRVTTLHPGGVSTRMVDYSGLIDVDESVTGMANVIADIDRYESGSFIAFDGKQVPY